MDEKGCSQMPWWLKVIRWILSNTYFNAINEFIDFGLMSYYEQQSEWDEGSDNDKLDHAFEMLKRKGIIGQVYPFYEDYAEKLIMMIELELESLYNDDVIGGIFITADDYFTHCEDGVIFFHTMSVAGNGFKVLKTAYDVLKKVGLNVEWDGTDEDQIMAIDFNWQYRRPVEAHLQNELKEVMLTA